MSIQIALAGNPNCGKTTLFNRITGENGYVGNWPGVTVEKKQAKLLSDKDVVVTDLPGIYSLSPYSPEEVVSRDYLVNDRPDVIVNLIDSTNLERNLYLTTQLVELGLPMVVGLNMADLLRKNGDKVDAAALAKDLGCPVVECSALKGEGVEALLAKAKEVAKAKKVAKPAFTLGETVEGALAKIADICAGAIPAGLSRWYGVKLFEGDEKACAPLRLTAEQKAQVAEVRKAVEASEEDDAESIVTMARYDVIADIIPHFIKKAPKKVSVTERIDRIVTNRWLGLPIFAVIMVFVYWISVSTVGTMGTDWANDGLFGDGWHLLAIGDSEYNDAVEESGWGDDYADYGDQITGYLEAASEAGIDDADAVLEQAESDDGIDTDSDEYATFLAAAQAADFKAEGIEYHDADGNDVDTEGNVILTSQDADGNEVLDLADGQEQQLMDVDVAGFENAVANPEPDPADYGIWVPGIPELVSDGLDAINVPEDSWVRSLILDGIVAGVGAILGFVPQMFVLFILLCFLEDCGYLSRVAFIMDRIFRRFGLSGKSFIPMLISSGCGVPGVMSTKTIENEGERRMTVMTTTMVPCGAKLPIIALLMGALIGDNTVWWISPLFYFLGIAAVIISGIMLKKTKPFAGEASPFVMELPAYHMPSIRSWCLHVWERVKSFIVKAGTIIFAATVLVWFLSNFGWTDGAFGLLDSGVDGYMDNSLLAAICGPISVIFYPLGFGGGDLAYPWQATAMSVTGLIAKENVVSTFAVLFSLGDAGENATLAWSAFGSQMLNGQTGALLAFAAFNLLCAPCFAAMGTIRRQMASSKWFWAAIGYECGFAWVVGLMINQFYLLFTGAGFTVWTAVAILALAAMLFQLFRPMPKYSEGTVATATAKDAE